MIRRLRRKFILLAVLAVFLVLLALIGSINILNFRSLVTQADETLRILAENGGSFPLQMRSWSSESSAFEFPGGGGGFLRRERGGFGELAFQSRYFSVCFDEDGSWTRIDMENVFSMRAAEARELAEKIYATGKTKGFTGDYRFCRCPSGDETMLIFLNCEREISTFRSFLFASAGISLAGILAVLVLVVLFSGRVVRPIAESYEKQKQFITDAGHELKTPITIINADVDVLEDSAREEDLEWLTDIRKQARRLTSLTADLIYLSRMEEDSAQLQMADFDLSELVEETAQSFQGPAKAQEKEFTVAVQPGITVNGDEKAIAKLASTLLDNAMKYSPAGGYVSVSLEKNGKNAQLTVSNTAESVEKGNQDRLFERFYRADSSRSSDTGGFGLGLAVAKAVAEAHKGSIHAESPDRKSLNVKAELPLR